MINALIEFNLGDKSCSAQLSKTEVLTEQSYQPTVSSLL